MQTPLNIMLIDDDEDDQEIFLNALENIRSPVVCTVAINGKDGFEKLKKAVVKPELIFLDLNMPLMNGKQFLAEMKRHDNFKDIPVIILTTSSDKESILETEKLGANHFITKPDQFNAWEAILRDVLERYATSK